MEVFQYMKHWCGQLTQGSVHWMGLVQYHMSNNIASAGSGSIGVSMERNVVQHCSVAYPRPRILITVAITVLQLCRVLDCNVLCSSTDQPYLYRHQVVSTSWTAKPMGIQVMNLIARASSLFALQSSKNVSKWMRICHSNKVGCHSRMRREDLNIWEWTAFLLHPEPLKSPMVS